MRLTSSCALGNFTVKFELQLLLASQLLFTTKVTWVVPPVLGGAPELLLEKTGLQPPVKLADCNQAENLVSIAAWVCPAASSRSCGQLNTTGGASVTENVALHVLGGSQLLESINWTVLDPPQKEGAPLLSLLKLASQPPEYVTVRNHLEKFVSISIWV